MLASFPAVQPTFLPVGEKGVEQAKSVSAFKQLFDSVDFVAGSSKSSLSVPEDKYEPINGTPKARRASLTEDSVKTPSVAGPSSTAPVSHGPTPTPPSPSKTPKRKPALFNGDIDVSWPATNFREHAAGLNNVGNTCFLNSALQCMLHTPPLLRLLVSHKSCNISTFCMICAMRDVTVKVHSTAHPVNPSAITSKLHIIAKHLKRGRQEDSHEFLRYAIDALQKACLHGQPAKLDPSISETTWVHKIFGGKLRSRVTCQSCGYNSDTFDSMMDLSLDIHRTNTIGQALKKFVATDYLKGSDKYKCDKCKKHVNAEKRFSIHEAPLVLTVHLKRFSPMGNKIGHPIDYEKQLVLRPYMSEGSYGPQYSLYGVICHSGGGPHSGHYFAHVKSKNGKWHEMNDEYVSASKPPLGLRNAYILFYVQDKGQKLNGAVSTTTTPTSSIPPTMTPPKLATTMKKRKERSDESPVEDTGEKMVTDKPFIGPVLPTVPPSPKRQKVEDPQAQALKSKISAQTSSALATLDQYGSDADDSGDGVKSDEKDVEMKSPVSPLAKKAEMTAAIPTSSFYESKKPAQWKNKSAGFSPFGRLGAKPHNNKSYGSKKKRPRPL